jgi:methylmalonyl-CoA mutase N-terminal domain/subunit
MRSIPFLRERCPMTDEIAEKLRQAYRETVTDYETQSGISVKEVYTQRDILDIDPQDEIGLPGQYPFTRGHHPLMYRGKLWNVREISGVSTPEAHNRRCKFLLEQGESALHWELDGPTQYGIEPDQPYAEGQVGLVGVTLHSVRDVDVLCRDLPLDELSLSCNCYYPDVWHAYLLVAKKRGYETTRLRGVGGAINYYGPAVFSSRMGQ